MITNSALVDGQPLTLGTSTTITAESRDLSGQDTSSQIQWFDVNGQLLGSGASLTYVASEVRMETVTARVGQSQDRVSFTVSDQSVTVSRNVKVLSDQVTVSNLNLGAGRIEVVNNDVLPTLKVGDVVIGAGGSVPPLKVQQLIQEVGNSLVLVVTPALPKDLIEIGTGTFEKVVNWSTNWNTTIVDRSDGTFNIADQLEPKAAGFKSRGQPVPIGLTVKAFTDLEWQPVYSGSLELDSSQGDGIKSLTIQQNSTFAVDSTLEANGYDLWADLSGQESPIQENVIVVNLGPVPIPIKLDLKTDVFTDSYVDIKNFAMVQAGYSNGQFEEVISYQLNDTEPIESWDYAATLTAGQFDVDLVNGSDLDGELDFDVFPNVQVEIFNQQSPRFGPRFATSIEGEGNFELTGVDTLGQNATLEGSANYTVIGGIYYSVRSIGNDAATNLILNSTGLASNVFDLIDPPRVALAGTSLNALPRELKRCMSLPPPAWGGCLANVKAVLCGGGGCGTALARVEFLEDVSRAINTFAALEFGYPANTPGIRGPQNIINIDTSVNTNANITAAETAFLDLIEELGDPGVTDFEVIPSRKYGEGFLSELPNGSKIFLRPNSALGEKLAEVTPGQEVPTIEIQVKYTEPGSPPRKELTLKFRFPKIPVTVTPNPPPL